MNFKKILYKTFLATGLFIGLTSCKKDDKNSDNVPDGTAEVTVIVVNDVDGDLTTLEDQTPVDDAIVIHLHIDGGNGNNILDESLSKKNRQTDKDGKYTFAKLLPGNYSVEFDLNDDNSWDIDKGFQAFPGKNEVKILATP